jgi:flavin-dependent dehydrogenase
VEVERVENVIVGAGPAGLRAAQVLAESGRDVLVIERNGRIGPKTCAGGLTAKAVDELESLGLPTHEGRTTVAHVSFLGEYPLRLNEARGWVRTVSRARLGAYQSEWARRAGAAISIGVPATDLNLESRTLRLGERLIQYEHLIGADGSASRVRRALGLPIRRDMFAGEFNISGAHYERLQIAFDSRTLGPGYFWAFPHDGYVSFGAGGAIDTIRPSAVRPYIEQRLASLGIDARDTPFEAATIETDYCGLHFPGNVHLAGDAAGLASALTGEGIYAAVVSGEEVARGILEPGYRAAKTLAWLRLKRLHDRIARLWGRPAILEASLHLLRVISRVDPIERKLSALFLG